MMMIIMMMMMIPQAEVIESAAGEDRVQANQRYGNVQVLRYFTFIAFLDLLYLLYLHPSPPPPTQGTKYSSNSKNNKRFSVKDICLFSQYISRSQTQLYGNWKRSDESWKGWGKPACSHNWQGSRAGKRRNQRRALWQTRYNLFVFFYFHSE